MRAARKIRLAALVAATVATAVACRQDTLYSRYRHVGLEGWDRDDTLVFCLPPAPADGLYQTTLGLRWRGDYPFTSLTLIVGRSATPSGHRLCDTVCLRMTDDEGNTTGRGTGMFQHQAPLPPMRLNQGDTLRVSVRHNMRRSLLPGLSDVGISLRGAGRQREQ